MVPRVVTVAGILVARVFTAGIVVPRVFTVAGILVARVFIEACILVLCVFTVEGILAPV